ncbi:MAG: MMPL family transporter [Myxococcales bacterium]|nr:MMPL family transporter [Myxococcales bacterium]
MRSLLPVDHPVIRSLHALEESFGVTDSLRIIVEGGTPEIRHAYVEALVPELAASERLVDVDYRLQSDFFIDHALYYLTEEEFDDLREHVEAWEHYELCSAAPDACLEPADPRAPERLRRLVEARRAQAVERTGFEDYYEREGIDAQVILATARRPASDARFASALVAEVEAKSQAVLARPGPWQGAGLDVRPNGPYPTQARATAAIRRDIVRSGAAGALGVLLILFLVFRSFRAVITLLIPLACGVAWSMGLTQLLLGRLNLVTSMITTVLMGIGIDAGIHLLSRIRGELAAHGPDEAIRRSFRGLIGPLVIAATTTAGTFGVMATSSFPAFREFGLIAGLGLLLCLLAMITVYPAILRLLGIKEPKRAPDAPGRGRWASLLLRRPGTVFAVTVVLTLAAFQGVRRVEFERNARSLMATEDRALSERDRALVESIFDQPLATAYLLVDDLEESRRILAAARPRHQARLEAGESLVASLVGPTDLLPPAKIDLAARRAAIEELEESLPERALDRLANPEEPGDDDLMSARDARLLQRMLAAQPFTLDDLPAQVLRKVRGQDGRFALVAYMSFDPGEILDGVRFIAETTTYTDAVDGLVFVGETTVNATIYQLMRDEAPVILGMSLVLIIALVFWQLRSLTRTLLTLVPLALAFWWMSAVMGVIGVRYSVLNVPILPAILGLGVDNGVYLMDRLRRARTHAEIVAGVRDTGGAILAATATTMVGFAAFLVAESGGLRGIGQVAVLGIAMAALAAITVLPSVAALTSRRTPRRRRKQRRRRGSRGHGTLPPLRRAPP